MNLLFVLDAEGGSWWRYRRCGVSSCATGIRVKKTGHAQEQDRPDVLSARKAWFAGQLELDPGKLIFVDETGASTKKARRYGRAPRGERLRMAVPHGHWMFGSPSLWLRRSNPVML